MHIFAGCKDYFHQPYILKWLNILHGHFEWRQWVLGILWRFLRIENHIHTWKMITHHRGNSSNVLLCVTCTSWNLADNCIISCFKSHMEILTTQCINGLLKFLEKSNLHLFSEFHILSRFCIKCPVSSSDDVWGWKWRGRFHFSFATRTRVNWFISDGESHWNTNKSTIKKKRRNRDENRNAGKKHCVLSAEVAQCRFLFHWMVDLF